MSTKSICTEKILKKKYYLKKLNIIQREMSHRIDVESIKFDDLNTNLTSIRRLIDPFLLNN